MASKQKPAYPLRLYGRIVAICQDSKKLKEKVKGRMGRGGLGWRGESARQALAAELSVHFARRAVQGQAVIPHLAQFERCVILDGEDEDEEKEQADNYARSDSMEPMRDCDGEKEKKRVSYVGWHSLNSEKMRKKRLEEVQGMYLSGGRFATVGKRERRELQDVLEDDADSADESKEITPPAAQHLADEEAELSSNPYPEDDYLLPRHTHSTPFLLRRYSEMHFDKIGTECQYAGPWSLDAPTSLPQPPPTPQPRTAPFSRPITPSPVPSKFSIWPSDRTISPITPTDASQHRLSPAPASSSFASFQSPSQSGGLLGQPSSVNQSTGREDGCHGYVGHGVEYPPNHPFHANHPFHGLDTQQRQAFWSELSSYHSSTPSLGFRSELRILRPDTRVGGCRFSLSPVQDGPLPGSAVESYEAITFPSLERSFLASLSLEARRLVEEAMSQESDLWVRPVKSVRSQGDIGAAIPEETEDGVGRRKRRGADRLLHTFSCRPGTCTPEFSARPVDHEIQPVVMAAVPKKYTMAYLARKLSHTPTAWRRTKAGQEQTTDQGLQMPAIATDGANTQLYTNVHQRSSDLPQGQQTNEQVNSSHRAESRIADVSSKTHRVLGPGPPVHPSKMIQHAPDNIRSPSPAMYPTAVSGAKTTCSAPHSCLQGAVTAAAAATTTTTTTRAPQPLEPRSQPSGSSLSDRLRATRLEDIRLHSDTAQEIRDLMLHLDRDRQESHTLTRQRNTGIISALPGGFTIASPPLLHNSNAFSAQQHVSSGCAQTTFPLPATTTRQSLAALADKPLDAADDL